MDIEFIDRRTGKMIKESPPGEKLLQFLYNHRLGKMSLELLIKRKVVSSLYGRYMDSRYSARKIASFVEDLGIDMTESKRDIEEFKTFNDFFYRRLKVGARPIGEGIVSPGDGKILAFQDASQVNSFYIKGKEFSLTEFLASTSYASTFNPGPMIILRLAPNDYHRYHFPYSGQASAPIKLKGPLYSVSPYALIQNFTKVFTENKREITDLQTASKGKILIIPVGATMVGSILQTYTSDSYVHKGDEMGYFAFGGSTIVLLFEKNRVIIDQDLLENTSKGWETGVKMGETIAR